MEQKVRFKMHKVKKNWVTIGVTALSMVTVAGGTLLADQQVQALLKFFTKGASPFRFL